jgi:HNH endonuclease
MPRPILYARTSVYILLHTRGCIYEWYTSAMKCFACDKLLTKRQQKKYCSNHCQQDMQYFEYIQKWKIGKTDGNRGKKVRLISKHLRRYLIEKYKERCSLCGWAKRHKITGLVPLEIDHIDGNAENNNENNLQLLCPNCHALTPHFRNLNRGNGRKWRQ